MQVSSFMCSGTMVIELCDKKKNVDKMQKLNLAKKWKFNEIFGTQFTFDMLRALKLKLKGRSEFPNVCMGRIQKP